MMNRTCFLIANNLKNSNMVFNGCRSFSSTPASGPSILDRLDSWSMEKLQLSGDEALGVTVDKFYESVLVDPALVKYFEGHDHAKLRRHQFNFMKSAFSGGKFKYTEKTMDVAHTRLFKMGLGGKEFDIVAGHLASTLKALNVPSDIQTDVMGVVGPLRGIFVEGHNKHAPK